MFMTQQPKTEQGASILLGFEFKIWYGVCIIIQSPNKFSLSEFYSPNFYSFAVIS